MKALILIFALLCISSTFAVRVRMRNHKAHKAHQIEAQASQEYDDTRVAELQATIDLFDSLINNAEGSKGFISHFAENNTDEVTKDEFFESLNGWSTSSGFGEQDRTEVDAIFDKIDKDGDGVLSSDEIYEGAADIFGLYRAMAQKELDKLNAQQVETRASQGNDDRVAELEANLDIFDSLINDPEGAKAFLSHFAENDTDEITKDEFFKDLNEWSTSNGFGEQDRAEIDAIFDKVDKDGNGVLSLDEIYEGAADIFGWFRDVIRQYLYGQIRVENSKYFS